MRSLCTNSTGAEVSGTARNFLITKYQLQLPTTWPDIVHPHCSSDFRIYWLGTALSL